MMGIVVLEELPAGSETLWLKMLSSGQSCQKAFSAIEQLSGSRRERNDILRVCAQYATYLQSRDPQELTKEEKAIMRTLEQIDALFDVEIPAAERRGKLQTIGLQVQAKFGDQPEIETILTRIAGLDETQLNAIAMEIFQWQTLADALAWLDRLEP
jgi:hypothetical protein